MFRIWQRVVYVGRWAEFRNKIWEIKQIKQGCCHVLYDIGLPGIRIWSCGCGHTEPSSVHWKSEFTLRPLDEDYAEGVLSEIKKNVDENLELLEIIKTKENV